MPKADNKALPIATGNKKRRRKNRFRLMKSILEGRVPFLPPSLRVTFENKDTPTCSSSLNSPPSLTVKDNEMPQNNEALITNVGNCVSILNSPGTPVRDEGFRALDYVKTVAVVTSWPRLEVAIPPGSPQPPSADALSGITPLDHPTKPSVTSAPEWDDDTLLIDAPSFETLCQEHGMEDLILAIAGEVGPVQFAEPFPITPGRDLERRVSLLSPLRGPLQGLSWEEYLGRPPSPTAEPILPDTPGRNM